jgi:hypothetical protein
LRLRLVVYGLLAVCAVLVFVTTRRDHEPKVVELAGRTSAGQKITLVVREGKLIAVQTRTATWCAHLHKSYSWYWAPSDGSVTPFAQSGGRFAVRQRWDYPDERPSSRAGTTLRGELHDGGTRARGSLWARGVWDYRPRAVVCSGRTSFSARLRD